MCIKCADIGVRMCGGRGRGAAGFVWEESQVCKRACKVA